MKTPATLLLAFLAHCIAASHERRTGTTGFQGQGRTYSEDEIDTLTMPSAGVPQQRSEAQRADPAHNDGDEVQIPETFSSRKDQSDGPTPSQALLVNVVEGSPAVSTEETLANAPEGGQNLLVMACNQSFVPFSYPATEIRAEITRRVNTNNLTLWCLVSSLWAADVNGTTCGQILQHADVHPSSVRLVTETDLKGSHQGHFDAVVASACAVHHAISSAPFKFIASLVKPEGLVQLSVLNHARRRIPETRSVLSILQQLAEKSEVEVVKQAVLNSFSHQHSVDYPEQLNSAATDTILHARFHVQELSLSDLFWETECVGLTPVSLENEHDYQLPDFAAADSSVLQVVELLSWKSKAVLGELLQGAAQAHTLVAQLATPAAGQCAGPDGPISVSELKAAQQELRLIFPTFPADLHRNSSANLVSGFALAEIDHHVWGGNMNLSEEPLRVLAMGVSCIDFAVSIALQLMMAVGSAQRSSSVLLLDDDLSGRSREFVEKRIQTLGLTNLQIVAQHSPEGVAALERQYDFVQLGEVVHEDALSSLQAATKLASAGVGILVQGQVQQRWRSELQTGLQTMSTASPLESQAGVQAAARLLGYISGGHRHASRLASLTTEASIAQATVSSQSGMVVSEIFNLAESAGLQVVGFRDQFLYENTLNVLESNLSAANATAMIRVLQKAPMQLLLALGELLNPDGIACHSVHLIPVGKFQPNLNQNWEMEAVPIAMPLINPGDLSTALEALNGRAARVTCHSQGMNGTMVLPELSGQILKYVDGHRTVATIQRLVKTQFPVASSALFRQQFNSMLQTFHSCNSMYLTYDRKKYGSLYSSISQSSKRRGQPHGDACVTKRCRLRKQREEQAKQVEDFAWRQELILNMGLHLMNVEGYQKGTTVI